MKNTLFLIFALIFSINADAQFGTKILKRKAERKAEQERDREIDKALDKTADKLRGLFKKKKRTKPTEEENENEDQETETSDEEIPMFDISDILGGGDVPEVADEYQFDFAVSWKMETNESKETAYIQYFPHEGSYISTSVAGIESIVDFERKVSISLIQNMANVINLDININEENIQADEHHEIGAFEFNRTGETKTVAGYEVEKFTFNSDDASGEIWATDELVFNRASIFSFFKNNPQAFGISEVDAPGMVLEIISTDKKNNETIRMYATEIKEEKRIIDVTKYKLMSMGSLGNLGN